MASVAGRYARAYAEVVDSRRLDADKAVAEFSAMVALINDNRELKNVLENPAVTHVQKLGLIDGIIKKLGSSPTLRNFIAVLVDHRRVAALDDILSQFKRELDLRMGIADAQVSSARELDAAERKSLEVELTRVTGKKVRAAYNQDPALLGGALVRVGSTIYDGSVRGQMERLRKQMAES